MTTIDRTEPESTETDWIAIAPVDGPPLAAPPGEPPIDPTATGRTAATGGDDSHDTGRRRARWRLSTHRWARLIHVYTSMIALVLVLFFGITGITLNHPDWTFGDDVEVSTESGTLPVDTTLDGGGVDFLSVSEYVRETYDVNGSVDSFDVTNGEGSIAYKNPGYAADLFFDVDTGEFELTVEQQGWVAVLNDLHKGRDAGSAWSWVIDLSAGFLVLISITGLVMQFFLRKRRRSALATAVVGGVIAVAVVVVTLA